MLQRLVIALALACVIGCASTRAITPAPSNANGANFLVALKGQLSLKREGWGQYAPARFGTLVRFGDALKLEPGTEATIACADLTVVQITRALSDVPCAVASGPIQYRGVTINPTRSSNTGLFPVVVAPRATKVLDPHPLVRWTEMPGATEYQVSVRGAGIDWTGAPVHGTDLVYPIDAPALAPGSSYKVTVATGNTSSDRDTTPGLGFTVLGENEAQTVRADEQKIRALGLDDAATRFLIAKMYYGRELYAEATQQLEPLSANAVEPAVVRQVGDLYAQVGLFDEAAEYYTRALDLATQENDLEGQALAQLGLAVTYNALGMHDDSVSGFEAALDLYNRLGDSTRVKQIQDRLAGTPMPVEGNQP